MLYREIIAVCSEIHTKHINTLCGQNVEVLNVKPGGTYSNHWTWQGLSAICAAYTDVWSRAVVVWRGRIMTQSSTVPRHTAALIKTLRAWVPNWPCVGAAIIAGTVTRLWTEQSGVRCPVGARECFVLTRVHTDPPAHPVSRLTGTRVTSATLSEGARSRPLSSI
jgi:hypothetical protein